MKANVKSLLTKLMLSVLFVAMIGLVLVNVNFSKVSAEVDPVFTMEQGAYVRQIDDEGGEYADDNGIRFVTKVNQAFVTAHPGATFYTKITANGTTVRKDWNPNFDQDGNYTRYTDLVNFPAQAYGTLFTVVSGYTVDTVDTDFATPVVRSMEYVAAVGMANGEDGLSAYIGGGNAYGANDLALTRTTINTTNTSNKIGAPGLTNIAKAYINGEVKEGATVSEGVVTIPQEILNGLAGDTVHTAVVLNGQDAYVATFNVYDYLIGTSEQMVAFVTALKTSGENRVCARLINSFVYEGGTTYSIIGTTAHTFTLDGDGYTIDGFNGRQGTFPGAKNSVIKNIGFTNMRTSQTNNAGLFFWNANANTVKNVYVHGSMTNFTGTACGVFTYNMSGLTLDGVLVDVDLPEGRYAVNQVDYAGSFSNVYVYSPGTADFAANGTPTGASYYTNAEDYLEDKDDIVATLGSMWEIKNGVPMFSTSAQYLGTPSNPEITISVPSAEMDVETAVLLAGEHTINTTPATTLSLKNVVEGISVSGNQLTIATSVAGNTEFTVVATYRDPLWLNVVTKELDCKVASATNVVGAEQIIGLNRNVANITLDLSSYATDFETSMIQEVKFNGNTAAGSTIENNVLQVPVSALGLGVGNLSAVIENGASTYNVIIPVGIYDYAIGNGAEFVAWRDAAQQSYTTDVYEITKSVTAVLDNNIDMSSTTVPKHKGEGTAMHGSLDGRGYTISNLKMPRISGSMNFVAYTMHELTVKNVSFDNATIVGYFWNSTQKNTETGSINLENCYFKFNSGLTRFGNSGSMFGDIKNVFIDATALTSFTAAFLYANTTFGEVENFVVCCASATTTDFANAATVAKSKNSALFANIDAFYTDQAAATPTIDTSVFSTDYWTITKTEGKVTNLVWKGRPDKA